MISMDNFDFNFFLTLYLIIFSLPIFTVLGLYAASIYFFIVKQYHKFMGSYSTKIYDVPLKVIAQFWSTVGSIWHGYEVVGLENIPHNKPALIIFYHSTMIIDYLYFQAIVLMEKNRFIRIVCDKFFFKIPGFGPMLEGSGATWGPIENCVSLLNEGNIIAIAPGGAREAFFGDNTYGLLWGNRTGFAKLAIEAKVPIIPIFTENCRESLRTIPFYSFFFKKLYEKTRLPLIFIYGFLPVKMRTFVGEPIEYDPSRSAEELKDLAKLKMEELIKKHQRIPGSVFHALLDRFDDKNIENKKID